MSAGGTSNAYARRQRSEVFAERYFVGQAIDIGAGPDSLARGHWPKLTSVRDWDMADGDAQLMHGVERSSYDLVYSSHCLEHVSDPIVALFRWWALVRPGGYLVLVVPDEDLYEQGFWPSRFNTSHTATFTVGKSASWSPVSINLLDALRNLPCHDIVKVERIEEGFDFTRPAQDQSASRHAEVCVEAIVRKVSQ